MAHYRYICFDSPGKCSEDQKPISREDLSKIDGLISDGELISLDTIRWMLPEMSEEKRRETFLKIVEQKWREAKINGLSSFFITVSD